MDEVEWSVGGARCPNHKVVLDKTNDKGVGICPISGCHFKYDEDAAKKEQKLKINALGQMVAEPDWKVEGDEQ